MTADTKLAQIEDEFRNYVSADGDVILTRPAEVGEIGLALVEIARAAQEVLDVASDSRPRYELPLCADALRAALARLEQT